MSSRPLVRPEMGFWEGRVGMVWVATASDQEAFVWKEQARC